METASHVTAVTLSDLEVYRFTLELVNLAPTVGGCFAEARYNLFDGPVAGATLDILSNDQVFYANDSNELLDVDTLELFEPDRVRLRTRDDRSFELSLAWGVERIEDHDGNSLVFQDDAIVHSNGKTLSIERDATGRITRITDPNDHQIVYGYDARGDLVSVTDQVGNTTRFTYDDDHRVLEVEDPLGNRAVRNDYDAHGRLVRVTDALGGAIELTHDLDNRRQVIRNRLGDVRVVEYDGRGNVVREIDERGSETLRTFDGR
ncbi:MAG: RHS repeat protein, partial [Actinomycetia bacterium]|nr:RHS repeat protein [Actinomycetes bacterium]